MLKDRYNRVMYRKVLRVVSIAVIVLLVLIALTLSASAADPTADSFGVEDANGYKNTNVTVPVNITNPQNGPIATIRFNISYNKSVISAIDAQKGDLTLVGWNSPDSTDFDWGTVVRIAPQADEYAIQNGTNGSVVVLNFSVLGEPGETSYMNLSGIELSHLGGFFVGTAPPQNGTFTVGSARAWYLHNDTRMYKGNMSKPEDTLTIVNGSSKNWTANEAATVDVEFPADYWTGWLKLNTPFTATENFTVAVGSYSTTTSNFTAAGTQNFTGDDSKTAFPLNIPANEFTVPKDNYLALNVTNPPAGSADLVIKTDGGNSFITSPETDPGYPIPELSSIILFSVGLLALAAYILRTRFLKR
uniref:Cohesin domain-containing protein n=1 Tax=Candidatus Methanophaga sp. ANME-1 ERB7 TaxID=2759913 RepID=A0A7G9Z8Z0_9EURY|nr:hypothetical protein HGIILDEE_00013 [Methanosarcinales archaeon ANME-1 ERB7]